MNLGTSDNSPKRKPGRQKGFSPKKKVDVDLNINDAEPMGMSIPEAHALPPQNVEKVDFAAIEARRFAKPERAPAAITNEDMEFEASLQRMHISQEIPNQEDGVPLVLTTENLDTHFLGDVVDDYAPAKSIIELEDHVFRAKTMGLDSVEATDEVIRYFTRKDYPEKTGYFMYKDIRVFITGRASTYKNSDKTNMYIY